MINHHKVELSKYLPLVGLEEAVVKSGYGLREMCGRLQLTVEWSSLKLVWQHPEEVMLKVILKNEEIMGARDKERKSRRIAQHVNRNHTYTFWYQSMLSMEKNKTKSRKIHEIKYDRGNNKDKKED